jgi:hypothetical protein
MKVGSAPGTGLKVRAVGGTKGSSGAAVVIGAEGGTSRALGCGVGVNAGKPGGAEALGSGDCALGWLVGCKVSLGLAADPGVRPVVPGTACGGTLGRGTVVGIADDGLAVAPAGGGRVTGVGRGAEDVPVTPIGATDVPGMFIQAIANPSTASGIPTNKAMSTVSRLFACAASSRGLVPPTCLKGGDPAA